ncbi:MAG: TonB-dependent receptor [Bacteroidales bacterium]|nr:TonB-dependent receptor [Bacteroidales bacterium]
MRKAFLFLPSLCLCASVAAQPPGEIDSTDVFFQHLELQEVVVTGLTGDSRLREMPAPVSVVRASDLQSRASTNLIGALAAQPGLSAITTGSGIAKPVIRGLGYNRVLVIHDGIRQEGQQWGDEHGIEIDGQGIHSVEILKGPASLMYGSDALAGVLILHSAPVAQAGTFRASVNTEYQTNNGLVDYSLDFGGNRRGVVWDLRYSDKYAHAYRNVYDGLVANSQFAERALSGMLGLNRNWGYSRLTLGHYHLNPGIIEGERDPETGGLEGETGYAPGLPFQHVYHDKAVLDNTFNLGLGRIKALFGWQRNDRQEYEESEEEYGLRFLLNTLTYDVKYLSDDRDGWKFATGVGGMYQKSDNKGEEYLIPAYRLFDAGLFGTVSKQAGAWNFTGGVRGDLRRLHSLPLTDDGAPRFEDFRRSFTGLTGSLGAVWNLTERINLRANVARGFRAPNLSELGSNGEHEGTLRYEVGNKDLKPEYSLQGDLGMDFSSKYVSGQLAVFASRIDNYIFTARNGEYAEEDLPVYEYRSGDARLHGIEASLDIHPVHSLHLENTFSYVRGWQPGGDDLPMMPAPRWTSEVKYELTHDGKLLNNTYFACNLEQYFRQTHILPGTETPTPAYTLLGLSLGTDLVIRGKTRASVQILVDNLLDVAYQNHLSRLKYADENPVTGRVGVFDMGRNVTLKLTVPIL